MEIFNAILIVSIVIAVIYSGIIVALLVIDTVNEWKKRNKDGTKSSVEPKDSDHVTCETCGAWIDKINKVTVYSWSTVGPDSESHEYYCNDHKKAYTKSYFDPTTFGIAYYAELQVNKDGTPVAKKKKKPVDKPIAS